MLMGFQDCLQGKQACLTARHPWKERVIPIEDIQPGDRHLCHLLRASCLSYCSDVQHGSISSSGEYDMRWVRFPRRDHAKACMGCTRYLSSGMLAQVRRAGSSSLGSSRPPASTKLRKNNFEASLPLHRPPPRSLRARRFYTCLDLAVAWFSQHVQTGAFDRPFARRMVVCARSQSRVIW